MKVVIEMRQNFAEDLQFMKGFIHENPNRPVLSHVEVSILKGIVSFKATNSYQLISIEVGKIDNDLIEYQEKCYPYAFFKAISQYMKRKNALLTIDTDNDVITFQEYSQRDNKSFGSKYSVTAFEGNYPKTSKLILKENKIEFEKGWALLIKYEYTSNLTLLSYLEFECASEENPEKQHKHKIYIDPKMMDPIIKKFMHAEEVTIWAQGEVRPVTFDFKLNDLMYTVLVLPTRVD